MFVVNINVQRLCSVIFTWAQTSVCFPCNEWVNPGLSNRWFVVLLSIFIMPPVFWLDIGRMSEVLQVVSAHSQTRFGEKKKQWCCSLGKGLMFYHVNKILMEGSWKNKHWLANEFNNVIEKKVFGCSNRWEFIMLFDLRHTHRNITYPKSSVGFMNTISNEKVILGTWKQAIQWCQFGVYLYLGYVDMKKSIIDLLYWLNPFALVVTGRRWSVPIVTIKEAVDSTARFAPVAYLRRIAN